MEIVQWIQHYFAPSYLIHQSIFTQLNSSPPPPILPVNKYCGLFFAKLKTDPVSPSHNFMMNCLPHPSTSNQWRMWQNSFWWIIFLVYSILFPKGKQSIFELTMIWSRMFVSQKRNLKAFLNLFSTIAKIKKKSQQHYKVMIELSRPSIFCSMD